MTEPQTQNVDSEEREVMMSQKSSNEFVREVSVRYRLATRPEKTVILDEFCLTGGYNRKYAIGLLRNPPSARMTPIRRPRAKRYGPEVVNALVRVWEFSGGICSKRLIPFLTEFLTALERFNLLCISDQTREKLLAISVATADRILSANRRQLPNRGLSTTKPGTLLRNQIPIHTYYSWDEQKPGHFEIDLVAHCAESTAGEYVNTLTLTDIATGWTECQSIQNRGQIGVVDAITRVRKLLPFPMLAIDSDNGAEFINHLLHNYCKTQKIGFTRCRPYKKNDQCHVEQKNWTVVRQHIGYARYEGAEECRLLQSVHRWLRLHINFFQPSMKLIYKERDKENAAKVHKKYDQARTPYQRLIASKILDETALEDLRTFYDGLNPVDILNELNGAILRLQKAQTARIKLANAADTAPNEA